jgi:hypothetical protein
MSQGDDALRIELNSETATIRWQELEPHYARGAVVRVAPGLDLVDVAVRFARDDKSAVQHWLDEGAVAPASAEEARAWRETDAPLWAVVTAPWVLVQEPGD